MTKSYAKIIAKSYKKKKKKQQSIYFNKTNQYYWLYNVAAPNKKKNVQV